MPLLRFLHVCECGYAVCCTYNSPSVVDGWFVLGTSALTGNVWDGGLSIFSGIEDYQQCPNLKMVACNTPSGVNDAVWYVNIVAVCMCVSLASPVLLVGRFRDPEVGINSVLSMNCLLDTLCVYHNPLSLQYFHSLFYSGRL